MKAFYVPSLILAGLLIVSLGVSGYVQSRTDTWIRAAESISAPLEEEHWNEIRSRLLALHTDWEKSQDCFHLILAHQALDETEKYFSGAFAACQEQDAVEFRILLAQLISQFAFLGGTQEVTVGNIL